MHYSYRRVHMLLRRDGWSVNAKRVYRLLGQQLRNKTPKRRVKAKLRDSRTKRDGSTRPGRWISFTINSQKVVRVPDDCRHLLAVLVSDRARFSYRGEDVVQTLEQVCKGIGYPKSIRVDQDSEFISRDLDLWAYQRGVILDFSRALVHEP